MRSSFTVRTTQQLVVQWWGSPDVTAHGRNGPWLIRPTAGRYGPRSQRCLPEHRRRPPRCLASLVVAAALAVTDTYDGYERCSLTDLMDMYTYMSDNSYQYHTVVLVTIIISRRIDRGISNWSVSSVPAVRIVRAVWVMGRIVWTPWWVVCP